MVRWDLVAAPKAHRPQRLTDDVYEAIERVLGSAVAALPSPVMMPVNALRRNLEATWSPSKEGGYVQNGSRIKISSRTVLELLAGAMSYERFAQAHGWDEGQFNMFSSCLAQGRLCKASKIEKLGSAEDDDWIEFEFGEPDPATSPFRLSTAKGVSFTFPTTGPNASPESDPPTGREKPPPPAISEPDPVNSVS